VKSLEALRILSECANGEKKLIFSDSLYLESIIKKELEHLKKIEENYYSLNMSYEDIEFENVRLEKENKKLKQAIDILKDKMNLAVYHNKVYNTYSLDLLKFKEDFEDELSQEEYELLKEVLENE
jgi:hypothetical protein